MTTPDLLAQPPMPSPWPALAPLLSEVCLVLGDEGAVTWASPNCAGLLGVDPDAALGTRLSDYIDQLEPGLVVDTTGASATTVRIAHPYRGTIWAELRRVHHDGGTLAVLRDVTQLRELQTALERTAIEDPLTGVGNRATVLRALTTEFARSQRYGRPLTIVAIDLDGLRNVNRDHGTDGGDVVLELVARTIDGCLRSADYVGRTDADEFLVLLPETRLDGAVQLAERVRQAIEGLCVRLPNGMARMTASLGVAPLGRNDDRQQLVERAEAGVRQGKRAGGNRVGVAQVRIS